LRSREQTIGVVVWVCVESGRHYGQDDLQLAEEIANRAALAVDNARLFKTARDGVAETIGGKAGDQLHCGKVTALSDGVGKGSEFTVRLPLAVTH